jgi:large subunit ribosomal protein L29
MKASDLRKKPLEDLIKLESEFLRETFNLHMQRATGQLSKSDQIKKVRKDTARLYTVMSEKGIRK